MRHWLRRLHLWFGLSAGLVFALIALSGTALVYEHAIEGWLYPQLNARTSAPLPSPADQAATLDQLIAGASPGTLRSIGLPVPNAPYWQLDRNDGSRVYLDPQGDRILLTRGDGFDPIRALHRFHANLLAGATGNLLVRFLGCCALFLLVSGMVLWWPRKGRLKQSLRPYLQPPTRRWVSWHRSTGAIALPLLLVVTASGTWLTFRGEQPHRAQATPQPARQAPGAFEQEAIDWPSLLERAQQAAPDAMLTSIRLPSRGDPQVDVRARLPGTGRLTIEVDPYSMQPAEIRAEARNRGGTGLMSVVHGLHAGRLGGTWWEIMVALSGLLPLFFVVTGLLFWWTRTKHRPG